MTKKLDVIMMAYKGKPIDLNKLKDVAKASIGLDFYPDISQDGKNAKFIHASGIQIWYKEFNRVEIAYIKPIGYAGMSIKETEDLISIFETAIIISKMIRDMQ